MTYVVASHSQKGGSGKSTLVLHTAVQAIRDGYTVDSWDCDPQQSLVETLDQRGEGLIDLDFGPIDRSASPKDALAFIHNRDVDLALIDTEPRSGERYEKFVTGADMVLVPVQPTVLDLRAVGKTVELLDRAKARNKAFFVINGAPPKRGVAENPSVLEAQEVLKSLYHVTTCPVVIRRRVAFQTALNDGSTVVEAFPRSQAAKEVTDFWNWLKGVMNNG